VALTILLHHAVNAKLLQPFASGGNANQTATETRHEIDGRRRRVLTGEDEIAFVFAVGIVHDDNDFAFANVGEDGLDGIKFGFHQRTQANLRAGKSHINRAVLGKFLMRFLKFTVRPAVFVYASIHDEQAVVD
jgi:hypothetical protein